MSDWFIMEKHTTYINHPLQSETLLLTLLKAQSIRELSQRKANCSAI